MDANQVESLLLAGRDEETEFTCHGTRRSGDWITPPRYFTGDKYTASVCFESWWEWADAEEYDYVVVPGLGVVSAVEFDTGGEGHGENTYMVFKVEPTTETDGVNETYFYRIDGYYSSYGGSDWDGNLYEVTPVQRMVTFYEKIEEK